jgi:GDP-4-dehydro-6-deoxy-D-mannose reductase
VGRRGEEVNRVRVLVTGITGFAGSHLVDTMLGMPGVEIFGLYRWRSPMDNIQHVLDKIQLRECDLRDAFSVRDVIEDVRPERIFHLAAQSFVPTSWTAPTECLTTNIVGQVNIFEAIRKIGIKPLIQIACSSEEYGLVHDDELPITEDNPLRPLSPYAVSKVGQDLLGYQYFMSYKLAVVRTRGFNHEGPRRPPVFVISDFARQVAEIERGVRPPVLRVGNLDAQRDFTDVRDMVRGYWLALEKGRPGDVYNICSGHSYSVRQIVDLLLGLTEVKIKVEQDPRRLRPSDVPVLRGDCTKFTRITNWQPEIPFEQTVEDILNYWRVR